MHRFDQYGKEKGERLAVAIKVCLVLLTLSDPSSVFQLELLEFQDTGDGTPHGVVLALVGAEVDCFQNGKERDVLRSIRMYNLASLTSLARWAVTQKVRSYAIVWRILTYMLLRMSNLLTSDGLPVGHLNNSPKNINTTPAYIKN